MRAVLCSAFTGPEDLRIGEVEEPKPAGDEILIDVHAASVSFMDNLIVSFIRCVHRHHSSPARKRPVSSSRLAKRSRDFGRVIAWRVRAGRAAMPNG